MKSSVSSATEKIYTQEIETNRSTQILGTYRLIFIEERQILQTMIQRSSTACCILTQQYELQMRTEKQINCKCEISLRKTEKNPSY